MFFVLNGFGDLIILIIVIVVVLSIVGHDDDSVKTFHRPGQKDKKDNW